jgi:hypothetical protein
MNPLAAFPNARSDLANYWRISIRKLWAIVAAMPALTVGGCGCNTLPVNVEEIKSSWSEVPNQYQRRADLIPYLANTFKGYAAQNKEVLMRVTEAVSLRASARSWRECRASTGGPTWLLTECGSRVRRSVTRFAAADDHIRA